MFWGYHTLTHRIHGTGIFTYIWLIFMANVGKYTIHGSYGIDLVSREKNRLVFRRGEKQLRRLMNLKTKPIYQPIDDPPTLYQTYTRWWFQIFFVFIPTKIPMLTNIFLNGLKPPTSISTQTGCFCCIFLKFFHQS